MFALIHIWQKNGCKFNKTEDQAVVEFSLKQLITTLGCRNIGGNTYKLFYSRIKDLIHYPYILSPDGTKALGFTFLSNINILYNENNFKKLTMRLTFNPFISRQLYYRKVFYRKKNII
ncbi:hypothetical protein AGMMS49936_09380 [Endomicrobiia bacterium]|nr:hypothetical protein AGMMS49936_09380 [Endomicrobiia bacterium]